MGKADLQVLSGWKKMSDTQKDEAMGSQRVSDNEMFLRLPDVLKIIPVSKTTWYQMMKDRVAPDKIKFGGRASFWKKSEVMAMVSKWQPPEPENVAPVSR